MKFIARILFGVDMSAGILIYTFFSVIYGVSFDPIILLFSIFCSFLPDSDFVPYLVLKRRMGLVSHWFFYHHPLLVIPSIAVAGWFSSNIWDVKVLPAWQNGY